MRIQRGASLGALAALSIVACGEGEFGETSSATGGTGNVTGTGAASGAGGFGGSAAAGGVTGTGATGGSPAGGASGSGAAGSGGASAAGGSTATGDVQQVSLGGNHTCARKKDSTVWCWGANNGRQTGSSGPDKVKPAVVAGVTATVVSMGYEFSCAFGSEIKCWGGGSSGQLGDGKGTTSSPVTAAVSNPSQIALPKLGHWHACAVAAGSAWCWGFDKDGALGLGTATGTKHLLPEKVVQLSGVTQVTAGEFHTCALVAGGAARCWGFNGFGELGGGTFAAANPTPVEVKGLTGVKQIAAGQQFTCAVTSGDGVSCWGSGSRGKLGHGSTSFKSSPNPVPGLTNIRQVACGFGHACAVSKSGALYCWGRNEFGQVGNNSKVDALSPVLINGVGSVDQVATGFHHTCAVTTTGVALCWGKNDRGQLGSNDKLDRLVPTAVSF